MTDDLIRDLALAHLAATLFMTGLIWFVQIVHYPLFAQTGRAEFAGYELRHSRLTTWVVGPPMVVEAVTATLLLVQPPPGVPVSLLVSGFVLLVIIWLSTALVQVPCHHVLTRGFDAAVHRRLVRSNWVRTIGWSLRALIVLSMV